MIDNFADNLCQKIEYRKYRKQIKNEILDHLYLTKDNYLKMNYDDAEAEDKAIADFGDPDEIIEDFNHIYKKPGFLYRLLQLSAIAMFLFLVVSFNNALEEKININDFIDESSLIESRDINASFSLGNLKYEAEKVFLFKDNQLYILMKRTKINPFQRYDTNYDFIYEDDLNFTYNFPLYNNGQLQEGVEYSVYNQRVFFIRQDDLSAIPNTVELKFSDLNKKLYTFELSLEKDNHGK